MLGYRTNFYDLISICIITPPQALCALLFGTISGSKSVILAFSSKLVSNIAHLFSFFADHLTVSHFVIPCRPKFPGRATVSKKHQTGGWE